MGPNEGNKLFHGVGNTGNTGNTYFQSSRNFFFEGGWSGHPWGWEFGVCCRCCRAAYGDRNGESVRWRDWFCVCGPIEGGAG